MSATNIGAGDRHLRRVLGYVGLVVAAGLSVWVIWQDIPALWRLFLVLPFAAGFVGVMQATAGT